MAEMEMFCFRCGEDVGYQLDDTVANAIGSVHFSLGVNCKCDSHGFSAWFPRHQIANNSYLYRMMIAKNVVVVGEKTLCFMDQNSFITGYEDDNEL